MSGKSSSSSLERASMICPSQLFSRREYFFEIRLFFIRSRTTPTAMMMVRTNRNTTVRMRICMAISRRGSFSKLEKNSSPNPFMNAMTCFKYLTNCSEFKMNLELSKELKRIKWFFQHSLGPHMKPFLCEILIISGRKHNNLRVSR